MIPVRFDPPGVTVRVATGTDALTAAREARVLLPAPCGGRGRCGKCAVRVLEGAPEPPSDEESRLLAGAPDGVRIACLLKVTSELVLQPVASVAAAHAAPIRGAVKGPVVGAVDLGTTNVVAVILDAAAGGQRGQASVPNPQQSFGADVASRMSEALAGSSGELRRLAAEGIEDALGSACASIACEHGDLRRVVVAGNSVMSHLALGESVAGLGRAPYRMAFEGPRRVSAGGLGIASLDAGVEFEIVPAVAPFVGGDVTAGILATDLDVAGSTRVLLDLGTNAEVVIAHRGRLTAASAAAGPAFEGGQLSCGGPAAPGAIESVAWSEGGLEVAVIGGVEPGWLCGTGVLDAVAALRRAGGLDAGGRILSDGPVSGLVHERDGVLSVQIAGGPGEPTDVYLTQLDVRAIQLAKAAVAAALELTLTAAGIGWKTVRALRMAGDFGYRLSRETLQVIGIVPGGFAPSFGLVGNASLQGAASIAFEPSEMGRAERIAATTESLDLATQAAFQEAFIRHTFFPEDPQGR